MNHRTLSTYAWLLFVVLLFPGLAAAALPAGWSTGDIGSVGAAGSVTYSGDLFTVSGAGADVWNTGDEFRFLYRKLTGDGEIVAQVETLQEIDAWTKAGVMMRETLTAGSKHAFMLASPEKGYAFQRRTSTGGDSANTSGGTGHAPAYLRLVRSGSTFTAYRSADGLAWVKVGSATITMTSTIYVGLAVSSHVDGRVAKAVFSHVSTITPLSSDWKTTDVGPVGAEGSAAESSGSITLKGAGSDVWDKSDRFRFAYTMMTGDGTIVTKVASVQNVNAWTKAGVMMRESLAAGSKHAFMLTSPAKGYAFQRRTSFESDSLNTSGGSGTAPGYVKLVRSGNTFTAYRSSNGTSWTKVGSASISMVSTIYVGVAVSSHVDATLASATFSDTTVAKDTSTGDDESSSGDDDEDAGGSSPPADGGSSTGTTLRLFHWNLHHGVGTDGKYDIDRIATWIAKSNPDVVSLNEVEKNTSWGNEDQPARYKALLEAKTGRKWYTVWAQEFGDWDSNGKGNLLLSRYPMSTTARYELSYERTVALAQIVVDGRNITVATTHLDPDNGSRRLTQTKELLAWFDNFAEARIVAGDMNAQPTSSEMTLVKETATDGWAAAKSGGYAYSASDNPNGYTRNSRIDFVFTSKAAGVLTPTRVEVIDARDSSGVMPSDHRPILSVYTVR